MFSVNYHKKQTQNKKCYNNQIEINNLKLKHKIKQELPIGKSTFFLIFEILKKCFV